MSRRTCLVCNKVFYSNINTARYCSDTCRKKARYEQQEKWKKDNPNYMKNYMRKYRGDLVRNEKSKEKNNQSTRINCSKCGVEKELVAENFYKNKNRKTGFESQCKECQKKNDSSWYKENKQRVSENKKRYYQQNKEKIKVRQREYYTTKENSL